MAKNNEEKKKNSPTKWAESTKDGVAKGTRIYGDVRVSDEDTRDRKVFKNYSSTAGASSPASGIQARNQRNRLGIGLSRFSQFSQFSSAKDFNEYAQMRRQAEEEEAMRSAADKLGGMFKTAQEIANERKQKQDQLLYNMSGIGSKDRVAGLNAYKGIAKKQAIDKEQNDDLRYSMSGIGGSDRLAGMQAYQDISEQQRRKEMQEASEALMQNYGYKRIGDGNRAVMATPFSPLPKMKEENTVTAAQAPGVFGIKPETYLEQMGAVKRWESDDLKPTQETSDFLGKYFGGRIPTEDEFNQKYEEIYNDYSIPDEDVRYFFETGAELIGKEMERQSSVIEAGTAYDEATGLLGKDAGKYLSDNEAEYMSRYALKPYGETSKDARPMFSEMEGPLAMSQEALERVYQNPFAYKTQDEQFDLQRRGVMTEEELTIYDAIARNAGEDAARTYLKEMEDELNQRVIEKETADAEGFAGDHPMLASLIAPLDRLAGGAQFGMMKAEELLTGKTPSAYDLRTMPTREADTLVQGVGQGIEESVGGFWGKAAGFGYQTLMSLADMGANMLLYGPAGAAAAGGAMGVSAASSAYNDAIDRGADQQTANAMAAVSGIAEMLFEKFSIEKLIGIAEGKGLDKAVLNIMRQMGVEASEEMATEVANVVGDTLLMGDKSTVVQEGLGTVLGNIGLAGLGGALMGGVSGGGAEIANSLAERSVEKELQTAAEEYAKQEAETNAAQQPAEIPDELATGLEAEYAGTAGEVAENAPETAEAAQSEAEQAQPEAEQAEEEKLAETPEKAENKDRFKAKKAATLTIDGENSAVDVVGVDSVSDTGLIMLEVEDQNGKRSVVNAADVSFADDASEELMGYAASERMDAKGLRSYMEGYDSSIATPEQYAEAYSSVYSRGRAGVDYDNAALNNSEARQYLSNDAMIAAYAAGENAYNQTHDTVQPAAIETASGNAAAPANAKLSAKEGVTTTRTRGRVSRQYSQAAFSKLGKEGRRNAMSQIELLGALASRTGHTIRVVDSLAGRDGKKANAMYNPRTREITVALDATGGAYAYAAAHELTHALRNEHKSEWNGFRDFVRGALERNGQVWEDLVKYQQDRFGYNREDAEEEVICNTVPALLKDERNLFELYKGNRTLFDRVVNWVKGLLEDVKNAGQALSSRSQSWAQMDALANDRKALQDIYDMMMRIMEGQSEEQIEENIINGVQESVMEAPVDASGNDVKYSLTTYTEELPKPIGVARAKKLGVDHTVRKLGGAGKRTVIASGRNVTEALMRYEGWSEAQISKVLTYTDKIAKWFEKAVGKYEYVNLQDVNDASIMIDHNTGEIVFSCQVPNAEYKVNFDFTTVCRQREAVQRFIDELSGEKGKNGTKLEDISLTAQNIWKLNEILKDEGYETACLGCFVEAKRYRIKAQADTLVQEWNDMVRAKNPNAEYFGFATGDTDLMKMSDEEIHKLEASMRGYNTKGTSKATQRAERLIELPEMQKLIRSSDIVSRQGRKKIREFSPALESFLVSRFGQGGAKPAVGFMPYNSEIAALPDTKSVGGKRMSLQQYLEMLGGARSNSFSDYIPSHALDYIQRTLDMAARRTTAQCYTKVPARARTFGRTGEKINMSVMFDIDAALHWSMAGLNASGEYIVGDKAHAEQAFKETGVRAFTQSIPFDEAVAIEHDPAYAENCGIIGVGYAYRHIAKMMGDDNVPYIIPYHRSSMPDAVARASNTKLATNYEDVQNTTRVTGYAVVTNLDEGEGTPSYAMWPEGKKKTRKSELTYDMQAALKRNGGDAKKTISEWLGWMADNNLTPNVSTAMAGHGDFDMYASLRKTKDPAKTANEYMAYCIEKGMAPVFFEFADQDGYDKTLFDFSVRNLVTGKTSLQGPVTFDWIDQMSAEDLMAMMDADMSEYNEYNREQFGSDKWNRVKEKGYEALQDDETENSYDIRYSLIDSDDNVRDAAKSAQSAFGMIRGHYITAAEADKLAGSLLKASNSDYDRQRLAAEISRTMDYIERGEDVDIMQVFDELTSMGARVMEKSKTLDLEHEERAKPIRDYLKTTKIRLTDKQRAEAESAAGSYGAYRKSVFGRVRLVSTGGVPLDSAWQELSQMDPELFPEDAKEGDMPALLQAAVDASKPVYHDGTGMTTEEGANWVALQLIDEYLKLPAVKAAVKNAKTFGESLTDLNKAVKRYKDSSWSEYQNALRAINEARDAKTKSEKQKELAAMRKKYKEWREKDAAQRRERELKRRYRAKIEATVKQLTDWMAKPTDAKHIPAGLEDTIRRMLESLDFSGKDTKTAKLLSERLSNLADVLQRAQESGEENQSIYLERDQQMIDEIRRVAELIRGNTEFQGMEGRGIYDLNGLELKELSKWLDVIKHNVIEASKLRGSELPYESVDEAAQLSMMELSGKKPLKDKKWIPEKWHEFFGPDMWDSFSFFERLGATANEIFKGLRRGFDKMTQLTREAEVFTKKLLDGVDLKKTTGKKAEKITYTTTHGETLELTRGNIMEIYVLSRREQATGHMYGGGILIANSKDAMPKVLTKVDVAKLTGMLSKDELRIADGLQRFLSKEAAAWGNATSRKLVGYNKFGEEFYWPINTDPNTRMTTKLEDNYAADINAIKNQGMTKATVQGANNAIVIGDIFDTYVRHISNMAAYAAYAIPLSDFTRWYNARGVKTQIDHIMGKKGLEYINNFLMAVNGSGLRIDQSGLSRLSAKLTRNAKIASVGANLRVVIQQPTSYARAALMISPKYLTAALTMKAPKKGLIDKYCGIAQWKHWGFYETNIGPSLRGVIVDDAGGMEKAREVATWLAGWGDDWTLNRLWNACTLEAKDRGYVEGSEGFYTFVGDRMSEIIDRTQVVDSVFHRSQIMRSKNPLNQMLTNFMSEPNKTFNMLMSAIEEYASNRKNKAAKIKLARTLATYAVTGVMTAAAAAVIDAFRDEDDEKEWLEKYGSALLENAGDNLNPLGLLPGVKDVLSFVEGYSNSAGRMDTQSIQKIVWAADEIRKAINGESKMSVWGVGYKVSQALSSLFGLPVSNVIREVNAIAQTITGRTITKNAEGRRSQTAGLLYDAMMGESKRDAKKLREELSGRAGMNPKEIDEQLAIRLAEEPEIAQAYEAKVTRDYATMNRIRNSFTARGFGGETFDRALEKYRNSYIKEKASEIAEDDLVIEAYNAKQAGQDATVEQKTKALMDRGYTQEAISEAISMYGKTQKDMDAQLESTLFTTDEAAGAIRVLAGLEKGTVTESDLKLMISERVAASDAEDPEASAKSSIAGALKATYLDLDAKGDTEGMKRLAKVMKDQLGTEQEKLDGWVSDKRGDDLRAAVDAYDVSAAGKIVQKLRKEGSADSDIKARLKTYKEKYLEAVRSKDTVTANKIKRTLIGLGLLSKKGEPLYSEKTFADWLKTK